MKSIIGLISQKNPTYPHDNKFNSALNKSKVFFNKFLLGSTIFASTFLPSFAQSNDNSPSNYNMPVITNLRSPIQKKDYHSDDIKSLIPNMISAGIFSNEQEALDAISSSNFLPYLRQIADSKDQALTNAFSNGVDYLKRTSFTDAQFSFSLFNNDASSFSAPISIGNIFYAYSPTRINDCSLYAKKTSSPSDTVYHLGQLYTTSYANVHTFGASMRINLDKTFIYDLGASYSFVTNTDEVIVPASAKIQLTNLGNRGAVSLDYLNATLSQNSQPIYDLGFSAGWNWARVISWLNDISNTNSSSLNLGLQLSPNAFFNEDINRHFSCTVYSLAQERSGEYEFLGGGRVDFNIANSVYINTTIEYNTDLSIKPTEWSYWLNLSIPLGSSNSK